MDINTYNYSLVKRILKRYSKLNKSTVEIFLTKKGYQKGQGGGRCWDYIDEIQVTLLKEEKIFEETEPPKPHPDFSAINIYHGDFNINKAKEWIYGYELSNQKSENPLLIAISKHKGIRKEAKKIIKMFIKNKYKAPNYLLVSCMHSRIRHAKTNKKFTKKDYLEKGKKNLYDKKIINRFRTLNKYLKPTGYQIHFEQEFSQIKRSK